jgi:hypothetical protein
LTPKPSCRVDQVKIPSAISRVEEKRNFEITPKKEKTRRGFGFSFQSQGQKRIGILKSPPKQTQKKEGKKEAKGWILF